jgi:hypothetical protein
MVNSPWRGSVFVTIDGLYWHIIDTLEFTHGIGHYEFVQISSNVTLPWSLLEVFWLIFFLFVFYIKDHIIREQRQFCFSSDSVYFLFLFLVLFCLTGLPTCCWERVVKRGFEKEAVEKYFHWGRWISECRTRFTLLSWIHSVIVSSSTWIRNIGNRSRTP